MTDVGPHRHGWSDRLSAEPSGKVWRVLCSLVLLISGVFLFARLGHYAFWDDEALTALGAQAVWATGDTSAFVGQNVVGWGRGIMLDGQLRDRFQPPLQFYVLAPVAAFAGTSTLLFRLPMAACGLATVALVLRWLRRDRASMATCLMVCLGLVANVSLFLFFRQCRYYALTMSLSVAFAYLYVHRRGSWGETALMAGVAVLLVLANFVNAAALGAAVVVDLIIAPRTPGGAGRWRRWGFVALPAAACATYLLATRAVVMSRVASEYRPGDGWLRAANLWLTVRDMNTCEFFCLPVFTVAAAFAWRARKASPEWSWRVLRGAVAILVYVIVVAPATARRPHGSEIRYVAPLIPLCVAVQGAFLGRVLGGARSRAAGAAVVFAAGLAFGTNVLHHVVPMPVTRTPEALPVRSTPGLYVRELADPPSDPYTVAAEWVGRNVAPGERVWVVPQYMTYPLMFAQPRAVYVWQFADPAMPGADLLRREQFVGEGIPDHVVAFGGIGQLRQAPAGLFGPGGEFRPVAEFDIHSLDQFRPELYWRSFREVRGKIPEDRILILSRNVGP